MKQILYVIFTPPPNTKSAGITYLNNLSKYLNLIGKNVLRIYHIETEKKLYIWDSDKIPEQNHWKNPWRGSWVEWTLDGYKQYFENYSVIIIHGENKHYKYFEGLNVVRYYLAGIGQLQKKGVPRDGEFKLAWDLLYCRDADHVLKKSTFRGDLKSAIDLSILNRKLDLTYVGKATLWGSPTPRIHQTLELTRSWPESDEEYFYLLSNTRYLYTYDSITSVVNDGIIYGALPIFLDQSLRSNQAWIESMNRVMKDCYAINGDDIDIIHEKFISARYDYITNELSGEEEYFLKLKYTCISIEKFFNLL